MSDTAAPLTESAPQSSSDIAASVIESAEHADTGSDTAAGDSGSETSTDRTETTEQQTKAEMSAARKFLQKLGHSEANRKGGNTYLPYRVVEKMLDQYAEEHGQTWQSERTTLEGKAKELQTHIDSLRAAVSGDPKAFLTELAGIDQRYQSFLTPQQQERREAVADAANDPMPQPDLDLGNGSRTYSVEGMEKRMAWERRQALRELEGKLEERFKPIAEREKAEKQRAEHEKMMGEVRERTASQMQEAQSWPLFGKLAEDGSLTEFQQAVLDELKKDSAAAEAAGKRPTLTLEGAYIRQASKRYVEDDTTKRERLLKEINGAAKSTATGRTTPDAVASSKPRSTADIVRETIAKAERG